MSPRQGKNSPMRASSISGGDGTCNGDGDGWQRWQWQSRCWWQLQPRWSTGMATAMANGDSNSDGRWQWQGWWQWQRRRRWLTAMATAMANGNSDGNGDGNKDGNGNDQRQLGWRWLMVTAMAIISQCWAMGGATAKSCLPHFRGRDPDSTRWIGVFYFFQLPVQFTKYLFVSPCQFSSQRILSAYWRSTPAPIVLFLKVS